MYIIYLINLYLNINGSFLIFLEEKERKNAEKEKAKIEYINCCVLTFHGVLFYIT